MRLATKAMLVIVNAVLLLSGCQVFAGATDGGSEAVVVEEVAAPVRESSPAAPEAAGPPAPEPEAVVVAPIATKPAAEAPTAVEQAIVWSQRYGEALEKIAAKDVEITRLSEENRRLADEAKTQRARLEQAEKELGEANDLLVEMERSLDAWKRDVLGFREEIRKAQASQIEALMKILTLLGAEEAEVEGVSGEEE